VSVYPKPRSLVPYVPPDSSVIQEIARLICEGLADRLENEAFCEPHVIRGFANFLELATQVRAKHLNAQQLIDKDQK
jgi:hypothetical protein